MKTSMIATLLVLIPSMACGAAWNASLDFEATEEQLASAKVTRVRSLKAFLTQDRGQQWEGSSEPLLLDLESGLRGVFRSEDEPWASVAEVAGYRFARLMGSRLVPPTVPRVLRPVRGQPWPFEGKREQPGSLQLYVDGKPTGDTLPADLSPKDASDIDVLSFVMGRYDNHGGNLLRDASGAPVLIDFENSLEPQQWRFGEFSFARRGGEHPAPPPQGGPADRPFPFDDPLKLVNPTLARIQKTFGPWWGQIWPEGMQGLHQLVQHHPRKTVHYALWADRLWVQCWARSRHPPFARVFSRATLARLEKLDAATLRSKVLSEEYRPVITGLILERRDQVLVSARKGTLVP